MKRIKTTVGTLFMLAGAAFAGEWQRNTFPSTKYVGSEFPAGAGWSHTEAVQDISVSPSDPKFRAMIANEWTMVYTEDGLNYKPLRMPHIGTPGTAADSVDFSPHDANTMYLRVTHDHWASMDPSNSPAGLWRGTRIPNQEMTWQHLYQPPADGYEAKEANNAGRSRMLEDPTVGRGNHIYFGTTSDGLKRSTDDGVTWETVVEALANHRIKTVMAVPAAGNETILYTIAEKKMPRRVAGQVPPVNFWQLPTGHAVQWQFNNNLNDSSGNGNHLTGSTVDRWTDSTMEGTHAAKFNGSSPLTSTNLIYAGTQQRLSVSAWVQTTSNADQSIISYDRNQYWELGTRAGRVLWTVRDAGGTVNELLGPRIDDGDWYHVGAVFDNGAMRIYVDGKEVAKRSGGNNRLGSGTTVTGVVGASFTGALDDVRIYNSLAFNLQNAQRLYLEEEHKNPNVQGQLWRIRVDAFGNVAEAVRLHAPLADFHDVEVDPHDPSKGWVIRKAIPLGWPYGGRELYQFSDFGETLTPSTAVLGGDQTFDVVMVNPGDSNHVLLACATSRNSGMRWSMDGGTTWNGRNRKVGDYIPSINSWMPMDYKTFATGIKAAGRGTQLIYRGSPFSFVPGEPKQILWIDQTMGGLLQSEDYGATWRTYAAGGPNKDLGQIAVAHSNPDHWAVGLYEHGWSVTTNNGLSWYAETHHNNTLLESLAALAEASGVGWTGARTGQGVAFHPTNSDIMVATWSENCYILRSTDAGLSWSDTGYRNPMRLGVDVFWSRTDPNRVYAGRMKSDDAGVTWSDIGKVVISVCDSDSDLLVGVDGMRNDVTTDLNLYVSTNGGASWTILPDPPRETVPGTSNQWGVTTTARKWGTMADALVAIDPGAASLRLLLAGRSGIYEYNEGANDWILRNTGLENNPHFNLIESVPWMGFVAFDPRPGFSHIVYAASHNDEATMGSWAGEGNLNHAYPGGENTDPYYRSTDGGITWEHLHGDNYPDAPGGGQIESMTVDSRGRMFAATTEGVYILSNRPPSFTPGLVFNFTNGTYPNGRLDSNVGWNGGGAGWVVTEPLGLVVNDTVADSKSQHTTALNTTEMTVGAILRFSESGTSPSSNWNTLLQIGLTGSEDLGLSLVRKQSVSEYQLVSTKGADVDGGFNSGRVDGSLLGLNLAGGDADSDRLYLTYTITRGAQTGNIWTATTRLYNLDTDPGMTNAIIRQNNLAVDPADVLWGEGLYPYLNSSNNNASGKITGLTIESFTANPEPASSSAPIVRANATEGSTYLESLVGSASDPDPADTLTFSKLSGPDWLSVAPNGTLSGTPGNADVGLNSFTVEVSDGRGATDSTTLEITVVAQPLVAYALWASDHGVGAMDEDFDKDGLDNLTEYALGGNPTNKSDVGLLPTHIRTAAGLNYVFRRRLDPAAAGLVYKVETTTNLASGDWTETGTVEIDTDEIDSEFESVINAVDTTDKPTLFIRLKIEAE